MVESGPPKVSIAIPFYNSRATLLDAIRSVFAQTFQDWELILLDDGSTDGSSQLVSSIRDPRVRIVSDGVNKGLPARLNEAAALARGDLLFRMDADDVMHPQRVAKQVEVLERDPSIQLACSTAVSIDAQSRVLGIRQPEALARTRQDVLRAGFALHPTVAGRRSWFVENPYSLDYDRAEDLELWVRTAPYDATHFEPTPLLFYREGFSGPQAFSKSLRTHRRIVGMYGPAAFGWARTLRFHAISLAKGVVWPIIHLLDRGPDVMKRRYRELPAAEQTAWQDTLDEIRALRLPDDGG